MFALLIANSVLPGLALAYPQKPSATDSIGYVVRAGGPKPTILKRAGKEIVLDKNRLKTLVELKEGDDLVAPEGSYVVYIVRNKVIREPSLTHATIGAINSSAYGPKLSNSFVGGRRLGTPPAPASKIITTSSERMPYYLGSKGDALFSWVTEKGIRATEISVDYQAKTLFKEMLPKAKAIPSPVGQYESKSLTEVMTRLPNGAPFTLRITFGSNNWSDAQFILLKSPNRFLDDAWKTLIATPFDSAEWFDSMNAVSGEYEKAGLSYQASNMVVMWWLNEPDSPIAKSAMLDMARKYNLGSIDEFFAKYN